MEYTENISVSDEPNRGWDWVYLILIVLFVFYTFKRCSDLEHRHGINHVSDAEMNVVKG